MSEDKRLIEDYLPIAAISAEASREKSVRKGHISTLHLWWARRPLVACRAAVYGALVPPDRWVKDVELKNPPADPEKAKAFKDGAKRGLNRRAAAEFVTRLCKYPGDPKVIAEAQRHILEAHAERITRATGQPVTVEDIEAGRAPRPKVLDMFAGGGAIPLEALRLGCETYALDLNPVAHIIELCTLVYPQKYGQPDPTVRGMTGPPLESRLQPVPQPPEGGIPTVGVPPSGGEASWGGLAKEVRYWGEWVLQKVKAKIGDLYPLIPDPTFEGKRKPGKDIFGKAAEVPPGYLVPVAYLWTRTVTCKNPTCKAVVPLVKQTWLCKKKVRFVALRVAAPKNAKQVRFEVVEAPTEKGLGFDPSVGSTAGNATCFFCGNVADADYVQKEGVEGRLGTQLMAVACTRPGSTGKVYLSAGGIPEEVFPEEAVIRRRIDAVCRNAGLTIPFESISSLRPSPNARGLSGLTRYGVTNFGLLFTSRQQLLLLSLCAAARGVEAEDERTKAIATYLGLLVGRIAIQNCAFTVYHTGRETIEGPMGDKKVPMVWDFPEANPFSGATGAVENALGWIVDVCTSLQDLGLAAFVARGDATRQNYAEESFDAVVTDPPYYDNVPYADIADFFYVWLRRCIGQQYPNHFAAELTPKKSELTALFARHQGDMDKANREYERGMELALSEANRVLKRGGRIVIVYAHKTTLGWATLVEALRKSGFAVIEAWPIETELAAGKVKIDKAMLASSIFLAASKGDREARGNYEDVVRPELETIVRERVETLWDQGISGADLVIACVGAGLRAFTRFARVEYANGEEVPAERFLTEVETVVLDSILARLSKEAQLESRLQAVPAKAGTPTTTLAGVDPATRFYLLWRYTYRAADLDAGEAIVFANGTHVELDGPSGLSSGARALVEKRKGKYRLRSYDERGDDDKLGRPSDDGQPAPLIDALHRTLWLMEHRPRELGDFFREAQPNREQMRLVAQGLAGPALKGGELADFSPTGELAALGKLTANWRGVIEDNVFSPSEQADRKRGQRRMFE
jgi:putative DNA methylase